MYKCIKQINWDIKWFKKIVKQKEKSFLNDKIEGKAFLGINKIEMKGLFFNIFHKLKSSAQVDYKISWQEYFFKKFFHNWVGEMEKVWTFVQMLNPLFIFDFIFSFVDLSVLYSYLNVHASQRHNIKDRLMNKGRMIKTQEDFFSNIFTSHFIARVRKVVEGLHVRGCWRPNINFIFWPHCYDRHVVSFLFS